MRCDEGPVNRVSKSAPKADLAKRSIGSFSRRAKNSAGKLGKQSGLSQGLNKLRGKGAVK